jgi:ketosteroid isomerase-like protein
MKGHAMPCDPTTVVRRLAQATSEHDLEAIVDCFAEDYRNETPVHPARGFRGREQVRRNWAQILNGVPDIVASVLAVAVDGDTVWSEWLMTGTRRDGVTHEMRGVNIFEVVDGRVASARFYLEPVDRVSGTVDDAVRAAVTPASGSETR